MKDEEKQKQKQMTLEREQIKVSDDIKFSQLYYN